MTDEKIRVLIVDDIAETRENIRKLLQFEGDVEIVGAAKTGKEGIQMSKEADPDVVLMDINMPDMDGIAATEAIRKSAPFTEIVILTVQSDSNYMRRAMLAGARDFLTKPPDVDELISAIRRAGALSHSEREKSVRPVLMPQAAVNPVTGQLVMPTIHQGSIITVYGPKGGVGTTTVAANLAVTLKSTDSSVVVVDGNLQYGDLSFFFNEQTKNNITDLAPRSDELDLEFVEEVVIEHAESGVKILAAPPRPEYAEVVSGEEISAILKFLKLVYSYVIVDSDSQLSDVTLAALDSSDLIVLITTQDIPAVKNARLFLDLADALGLDRDRILLVMNRFDKRRSNITAEKVSENFKKEFSAIIPMEERLVVPAMDRGVPFMLQTSTHPVARSMRSLAKKVRDNAAELKKLEMEEAA